ncbi:MAG: succinate dehydrogenase/fumarate reductase iron-sulfur subunit [Bdellovibrionota bacterium]|nr:succinate dehydrogenase/fumarate reductase iron-sulfur subunit [Bdellovibrionota bacterium]
MSNENNMNLNLKIWRQKDSKTKGSMEDYTLTNVSPDSSFLEMLDQLNEELVSKGIEPVAFDHDCREGICGMCSLMINGQAHGPEKETTTCQLHMRSFSDGDTIVIEPWRARAFPVQKDLMVDRSAFDEIIAAGGYTNVSAGNAPDANSILISKENADLAMDAAACIGCGACVASCSNASAMLFVSAKVSQLSLLPQGQAESEQRVQNMVKKMDELGFGNCTNEAECEASCPKGIEISNIARMNKDFLFAAVSSKSKPTV